MAAEGKRVRRTGGLSIMRCMFVGMNIYKSEYLVTRIRMKKIKAMSAYHMAICEMDLCPIVKLDAREME